MNSRFERQTVIPQIGESGQEILQNSCVAVIGAGGLGCPVLTYLAAVGVGKIIIIEFDEVSVSNLNRQMLYGIDDIGKPKAQIAATHLTRQYGDIEVIPKAIRLTKENIAEAVFGADVIVDCVDNIATRLLVNDFAIENKIMVVEGGISGFYGFQFTVLGEHPCLRCAGFTEQKNSPKTFTPAIGATAGIIGSLQASVCIKLLLGQTEGLKGKLLQYDGIRLEFDETSVVSNPTCKV